MKRLYHNLFATLKRKLRVVTTNPHNLRIEFIFISHRSEKVQTLRNFLSGADGFAFGEKVSLQIHSAIDGQTQLPFFENLHADS